MRRWRAFLLLSLLFAGVGSGCGGGDAGAEAVAAAHELARSGDLPGGVAAMDAAWAENPESLDAAVAAAWGAFLRGRYEEADGILAKVQESAAERTGEVALRRALVAQARGNLDDVRRHAEASGLAAGKLLAAEVALADGERDAASRLLAEARAGTDPTVTATADDYLALMGDADPVVQGLSEAQALWALGEKKVAVRAVEELLRSWPSERDDHSDLLLLWAGRAATAGEPRVATTLLDIVDLAPAGQRWRLDATRGIVACAEGDATTCAQALDALEGMAPPAGLRDARATAAIALAPHDAGAAASIAGEGASPSVARALLEAGARAEAQERVASGILSSYLEQGG